LSWLKGMMDKEPPEPTNPIGVVVIGNFEGDRVHQNSKDMVRKSLKKAQFKTIDIGKNVSAETFVSKAKEYNADIIAVSINTTMALDNVSKLLPAVEAAGLQDKVTIMVGGAAVDDDDAKELGFLYGATREEAVAIAKRAIKKS
jgi:methanogenic corrinoid protein MtbC1